MRTLKSLAMASAFIGTAAANVWYPSAVYQSSLDRIVAFRR
jgi:hypothetical protein